MEEIKKQIKDHRKIADTSLNIYSRNITKLAKDMTESEFENINFLLDTEKVIENIKDKSLSTKKNYLSSILVFLNPTSYLNKIEDNNVKDAIKIYTKLLKDYHIEYTEVIAEQKKSKQQSKNWVSMDDLFEVNKKYKNEVKKYGITLNSIKIKEKYKLDALQKYVVTSLYLLHPPRRCEYSDMVIVSQKEYDKLKWHDREMNNYLVVGGRNSKNKFFSFGSYKTREKMGVQKIPMDSKLNTVLNLWLRHNPSKYLILDSRGLQMSRNGLTKYLCKVFQGTGKKNISANMIRHIYLSEKYGNETTYKEKQEDATAMGHSVKVQQQVYVKKD